MRVDNTNGDPSVEPLIDPVPEDGYDDDYEDDDEGEAEYEEDDTSTLRRRTPPSGLRGLVAYLATNLVDDPEASRWRPANGAAASSSACAFPRRNWARSSVAAAASPAPCAQRS